VSTTLFASGIPFPEGPAFLPDEALVVCARRDDYLVRVVLDGSVSRLLDMTGSPPNGCKRHRDGRLFVAATSGPSIAAVDASGGVQPIVAECDDGPLLGPNDVVFRADGRCISLTPACTSSPSAGCAGRGVPGIIKLRVHLRNADLYSFLLAD
jgi:sugar lactone lactonase YvrE